MNFGFYFVSWNLFFFTITDCKVLFFKDLYLKSPYLSNHFYRSVDQIVCKDSILYPQDGDSLLISASKSIIKLDVKTMNVLQELFIPQYDSYSSCFRNQYPNEYPCQLFGYWTKILPSTSESDNHQLFICHNNASATYYDFNSFKKIETLQSICPKCGIISFLSSDKHIYMGDLMSGPKILRFNPEYPKDFTFRPKKQLDTRMDSLWIQQNDYLRFIYIFESNNFVYFLIREVAEEDMRYCDVKAVKSRIVRISKSDNGGDPYRLTKNWVSFVKATIICPDKSNNLKDSSLNFVESAHFDKDRQILYATFSSGETKVTGICQYSLNDIEMAFDGPYMDIYKPKIPVSKSETFCDKPYCLIGTAVKYQLKFNSVVPNLKKNLAFQKGEIWTHIQVISIVRSSRQYDILFVATSKNQIKKYFRKITDNSLCYSETLFLLPNSDNNQIPTITDMKLINSKTFQQPFLIVTVLNGVYKIGIEHCVIHSTETSCIDPFCFWNKLTGECTSIYHITVFQLRQLPELEYCFDGRELFETKWEPWSSWESCGNNDNICQCRMRNCKFGYCTNLDNTENLEIEVKNCSIHQQWTSWSAWSGCSTECGVGNSTRNRICFQGNNCLGKAVEIKPCEIDNKCKGKSTNFIAVWSNWSECFPKCGPGIMRRKKLCPENYYSDHFQMDVCSLIEVKNCSVDKCISINQMSPVARLTEESNEAYYMTDCRGTKSENNDEIIVSIEYDMRNYSSFSDSVWSCWSNWTECSNNCLDSSDEIVKTSRKRICKITNELIKNDVCSERIIDEKDCVDELCSKGNSEEKGFQLIYVILVGLVSFTISCLIVVAAVCIYFCRKKPITKFSLNTLQTQSLQRTKYMRESYSPSQRSPTNSALDYGWTPSEGYFSANRQNKRLIPQPIVIPPPMIS